MPLAFITIEIGNPSDPAPTHPVTFGYALASNVQMGHLKPTFVTVFSHGATLKTLTNEMNNISVQKSAGKPCINKFICSPNDSILNPVYSLIGSPVSLVYQSCLETSQGERDKVLYILARHEKYIPHPNLVDLRGTFWKIYDPRSSVGIRG